MRNRCSKRFRLEGILGRAALYGMIISTSFHSCSAFWEEPYKTYLVAAGAIVAITEGGFLMKSHGELAEKDDEIKRLQSCVNKNDEAPVSSGAGSADVDYEELQGLRQKAGILSKMVQDLTSENTKLSEQLSKQGGSNEQDLHRQVDELKTRVKNLDTENTDLKSKLTEQLKQGSLQTQDLRRQVDELKTQLRNLSTENANLKSKLASPEKENDEGEVPLSSSGKIISIDELDV